MEEIMSLLKLKDLQVSAGGKDILFGINLNVNKGEVHVIMGPNGSGKSTLANALVGNPEYSIDGGEILLEGEKINKLEVDERAKKGIFLSFQIPQEIPGLSLFDFLKAAKEAVTGEKISILKFHKQVKEKMEKIKFDASYLKRELNVGFSGGEKKKSEIIQMAVLEPKLAILDETDSGLDRDATKIVFESLKAIKTKDSSLIIITHYNKVLEYLNPDFVHIIMEGKLIATGGKELVNMIEDEGYDKIRERYVNNKR